jgi:NAD(P)-dependent dehydrogenase (short-subunit alcohol dehydrogenase family)
VVGSVSDWAVAERLTRTCISEFGAIDGLINNAALHYIELPWSEDATQIRRLIEVNVLGTIYCGVHALKAMISQRRGSIVNVTSGAHLGMELRSTYGASKGAIASLTYGWAGEAMPYNVRVNALSPVASTPMTVASIEDQKRFGHLKRPVGDTLSPDSIAPLANYLVSDLSQGITGQIVRMAWNQISVLAHPMDVPPSESRERWSENEIAAAFDQNFRKHLKPFGVGIKAYAWDPGKGQDGARVGAN